MTGPGSSDQQAPAAAEVLLATSQEQLRAGLRELLAVEGIGSVGEVDSGAAAVSAVMAAVRDHGRPPVVVIGPRLFGELSTFEATRLITRTVKGTCVLLLTIERSEPVERSAVEVGAKLVLEPSCPVEELVEAVRFLLAERDARAVELPRALLEAAREPAEPAEPAAPAKPPAASPPAASPQAAPPLVVSPPVSSLTPSSAGPAGPRLARTADGAAAPAAAGAIGHHSATRGWAAEA